MPRFPRRFTVSPRRASTLVSGGLPLLALLGALGAGAGCEGVKLDLGEEDGLDSALELDSADSSGGDSSADSAPDTGADTGEETDGVSFAD